MGRINPARFERVAAAFDADVARVRLCESSGSEHSPEEGSHDLSDLVKSFMERGEEGELDGGGVHWDDGVENLERSDSEMREMLEGIFGHDDDDDDAKEKIRREVEFAWGLVQEKENSSPQFKRQLLSRLRDRGFDAGLCKCKWGKNIRFPAGDYEYVDVNFAGNRYIVEISLVSEFEIARATNQYSSLLDVFPRIFVGKLEELKQVVRLMCNAIKGSMKSMDMYIPPWRRVDYMQAKWFNSYKRTTGEVATNKRTSSVYSHGAFSTTKSIGFDARPTKSYNLNCRDDYGRKPAFRVCHLTAALYADWDAVIVK